MRADVTARFSGVAPTSAISMAIDDGSAGTDVGSADDELGAELLRRAVAEPTPLGEVVAGVDVEQRQRHLRRAERLLGEAQEADGILAAGKKQRGAFEFARDLAHDVDGFGFEMLEMIEVVGRH